VDLRPWLALALALGLAALPCAANAANAGTSAPPASPATPKRPIPNYGGLPGAKHPARDAALWGPRILLSPLYLTTEYALRAPLAVIVPAAERADVPRKVYDFFTWGPRHEAGIVPVGLIEFNGNPSVGVYAFWRDFFARDNDWSLHAEAWPTDWYAVSVNESVRLDAERTLRLHFGGSHRPDRVFFGVGPTTLQSYQSRFTDALTEESAALEWKYWRDSHLRLAVGLRSDFTGPGSYGGDPSLEQEARSGAFAVPYGFGRRFTAEYNQASVTVDTRPTYDKQKELPPRRTGLLFEARGVQASDMLSSSGWVRYGGQVTGFVDLDGHQRVLSLSAAAELADPLGPEPVPFTELVSIGADGPMRGFLAGRMRGRSGTAATLKYTWPVAPFLGGTLQAGVGNAFDAHLQGFRPDLLRFSGDVGLTTIDLADYPIEAIVGLGSETFAHGGQIDSLRVMLSVNHGF
jgi:hypothetical protein